MTLEECKRRTLTAGGKLLGNRFSNMGTSSSQTPSNTPKSGRGKRMQAIASKQTPKREKPLIVRAQTPSIPPATRDVYASPETRKSDFDSMVSSEPKPPPTSFGKLAAKAWQTTQENMAEFTWVPPAKRQRTPDNDDKVDWPDSLPPAKPAAQPPLLRAKFYSRQHGAAAPYRGRHSQGELSFRSSQNQQNNWGQPRRGRPLGMTNLGNTCYMNAMLQALLGFGPFVEDLEAAAAKQHAQKADSVLVSLLNFAKAKMAADKGEVTKGSLSPEQLKRSMEDRVAEFRGYLQQDAHEFLCALLEQLQVEVLRREAAALGATRIPLAATACPAARNFSFCIEHQVTCSQCQEVTKLQEQFMHLSLELPSDAEALRDIQQLLADHLQDEEVEKTCEACGAENAAHSVHHVLRRLPRILALHLKRFRVEASAAGVQPRLRKMHTRVAVSQTLELLPHMDSSTQPPLKQSTKDGVHPTSSGEKENSAGAANDAVPKRRRLLAPITAAAEPRTPSPQQRVTEEERDLMEALRRSERDYHVSDRAATPKRMFACLRSEPLSCDETNAVSLLDEDTDSEELQKALEASRRAAAGEDADLQRALAASIAEASPAADMGSPTARLSDLFATKESTPPPSATAATQMSGTAAGEAAAAAAAKRPRPDAAGGGNAAAKAAPEEAAEADSLLEPLEWFEIQEPEATTAAATESQARYRLQSVINHIGATANSGHFTADVRDVRQQQWFKHNDTLVSPLDPSDALTRRDWQETCYILMYECVA